MPQSVLMLRFPGAFGKQQSSQSEYHHRDRLQPPDSSRNWIKTRSNGTGLELSYKSLRQPALQFHPPRLVYGRARLTCQETASNAKRDRRSAANHRCVRFRMACQ